MSAEPTPWIDDFNAQVGSVARFLNITTGSEIQAGAIEVLEEALVGLNERKKVSIKSRDEDLANAVLGCECIAKALRCELRMWMSLKKEAPHAAWNFLVDAQSAYMNAARAHMDLRDWARHHERLSLVEKLIYPKQIFMSPGGEVVGARCSICDAEYGDCDHVRGRPYMGEFCHRIIHRMKITEVSIVEEPANKSCRVVDMDFDGTRRDTLTWRAVRATDSTLPE